jgi:hypothetical protein
MLTDEVARKQLETLYQEGITLVGEFGAEQRRLRKLYPTRVSKHGPHVTIVKFGSDDKRAMKKHEEPEPAPPAADHTRFEERYQSWYSRTLPLMKQLALDRYIEFQSFYVVDPRYPWGNRTAYVIQDFFRGREEDDADEATARCFRSQLAILKSVSDRLAWSALDSEDQAERGLQLALLETARNLMSVNERAAGVLAGTVLEGYLKRLSATRKLKFRKQVPPLREYIDALHAAKVFDTPVHAQATWLAELDSRSRSEGEAPTKLQVRDLIDGSRWLIANVF